MISLPEDLQESAHIFLDSLFENIDSYKIDVSSYELDHICYRVASIDEYLEMKHVLSQFGSPIKWEHIIWGRPISTFKLSSPIIYKNREISLIELPSPKTGSPYSTGWEHAEFVIDTDLDSFIERYNQIHWDLWGYQKSINPDISIRFEDNTSIKFHEKNLEYVINYLQ